MPGEGVRFTSGSGDLEGGWHAAFDRIRHDLHAAHLHRVVIVLICKPQPRPRQQPQKLVNSDEIFTSVNPKVAAKDEGSVGCYSLQYSTSVTADADGRRRRMQAAARRARARRLCLVAMVVVLDLGS